jgi:hypothetical protein
MINVDQIQGIGQGVYDRGQAAAANVTGRMGAWGERAVSGSGGGLYSVFRRSVAHQLGFMSVDVGGSHVSAGWMGRDMFAAKAYEKTFAQRYDLGRQLGWSKAKSRTGAQEAARAAMKGKGGSWKVTAGLVRDEVSVATKSWGEFARFGKGALGYGLRLIGPAFVAHSAYTGYREGGVLGAAIEGGKTVLEFAAFDMGLKVLGGATAGAAMTGGALAIGGIGIYAHGKMAADLKKNMQKMEMGGGVVDPFGMVATTRQRSLAALNLTHINGRMALGNEASLMHLSVAR